MPPIISRGFRGRRDHAQSDHAQSDHAQSFRTLHFALECGPGVDRHYIEECGVGPAERTGKSLTTYWPGGTRSLNSARPTTCSRRWKLSTRTWSPPRKPAMREAQNGSDGGLFATSGPREDGGPRQFTAIEP